ncbi:hypothetical protein TTHT_1060 [Thermotomaculum hydrothermale]|uniref:Uncharacterized protein n=1 Tax=Thermotomaculum hydrothermale TaxID=981385 RepID=A0A7R6PF59_9BACT|nr:hypothetical protein [Thermotomaculum hydrothermale]BBB32598.1 hypothetical protein TTHT_1060 [Thermotomaculum hydrothermale]
MKKIVLIFILCSLPLFGWSDLTVNYMIVNAYKTFPEGLRLYLENNKKDILNGAKSVKESDFSSKKEIEAFVCMEKKIIERMIKNRQKIKKIAYEFGRMFKGIAILSYPFSFEKSFYSKDYNNYTEYKLEKFIFAFKKVNITNLKSNNCENLVKSLYRKSRELRVRIVNDYKIYGNSSQFDDLSAAFGSASLLFSDSCLTMSILSADIWLKANGSLSGCLTVKRGNE